MRWYQQIHPDDKQRWSGEAAEMFLSGQPLKSAYRVVARDGRVLWFHCEAKMIRRDDGQPWFIHGVGVDITELKQAENELQQERNVLSAILDTVGALVVVLDHGWKNCAFRSRVRADDRIFLWGSKREIYLGPVPAAGRGGRFQEGSGAIEVR